MQVIRLHEERASPGGMLPSLAACHPPARPQLGAWESSSSIPHGRPWMWPRDGRVQLQGCAPTAGLSHKEGGSRVSPLCLGKCHQVGGANSIVVLPRLALWAKSLTRSRVQLYQWLEKHGIVFLGQSILIPAEISDTAPFPGPHSAAAQRLCPALWYRDPWDPLGQGTPCALCMAQAPSWPHIPSKIPVCTDLGAAARCQHRGAGTSPCRVCLGMDCPPGGQHGRKATTRAETAVPPRGEPPGLHQSPLTSPPAPQPWETFHNPCPEQDD